MFFGKLIGAVIGWYSLGFFGCLIGIFVGHMFDRGLLVTQQRFSPEQRAAMEQAFFDTLFPLLGQLAKSDGRVSEDEIQATEAMISKMGLDTQKRSEAIALFKQGSDPDFDAEPVIAGFLAVAGDYREIKQILLVYLVTLAYSDGDMHPSEERILHDLAKQFGYSTFAFNHLMGMIKAQSHFYRGQQGQYHSEGGSSAASYDDELELSYQALGVSESVSDAELKRAYRKLMSEYHPDKLAGRGVPEEMIKVATERSQEIQTAYDFVKKHRKG